MPNKMLNRFIATLIALWTSVTLAQAIETQAKAAMVLDQTTGIVLLAKNADTPLPPASMSKLMTLNMLFEALDDGRVGLETEFTVSAKAAEMGGSKMFVRAGSTVSVENLIRGIVVQSGNDACVVVAENLGGSEAEFARLMNSRAKQLGMDDSTFANSTGWPHPQQRMSPRDLVFLADRLITKFPHYYEYFGEKEFTWSDITQQNRNPILGKVSGADGLKTGHTSEAGYGLVASAKQGKRRIIVMVTGLPSNAARSEEAVRLINWAFRQFAQKTLFKAGEPVSKADVWMGSANQVSLISNQDIEILVPYENKEDVSLSVVYNGPLPAPLEKGQKVAELVVEIPNLEATRIPLHSAATVDEGGILKRVQAAAQLLTAQVLGQ